MKLTTKITKNLSTEACACLVVPIFESKLSAVAKDIDIANGKVISKLIKQEIVSGKVGATFLLPNFSSKINNLVIVGFGKLTELNATKFNNALERCFSRLIEFKQKEASLCLAEIKVKAQDDDFVYRSCILKAFDAVYQLNKFKQKPHNKINLQKLNFICTNNAERDLIAQAIKIGSSTAVGINFAKNLANLPSNVCTPEYLSKQAKQLAKYKKVSAKILDKKAIEKLNMGCFLGVASGSNLDPKLIVLEYRGGKNTEQPTVLVGKGITFDTGGHSLKPSINMVGMQFDMTGAATVLGTMQAIIDAELSINVVCIIPTCENIPGGNAIKPNDILTSMQGLTVEVLNTDAEGRLILCDALTYAERFKPRAVIDVATLTGACVIALGKEASGLFSNNQQLANQLLKAGVKTFDRAWQLPIWEEYSAKLSSTFADIANVTMDRQAGSIVAACFLAKFTTKYPWAHLDIAATATNQSDTQATGRPIPLLMEYFNSLGKE